MNRFIIDYFDEIEFAKLSRALKKYNLYAFEKLNLQYYPYIKTGKFVGDLLSKDESRNTETYLLRLPSTRLFSMIHGDVYLKYVVSYSQNIVMLDTIAPNDLFLEGITNDLLEYKGVVISKMKKESSKLMIDMIMSDHDLNYLFEVINNDFNYSSKCKCPHCNGSGYIEN